MSSNQKTDYSKAPSLLASLGAGSSFGAGSSLFDRASSLGASTTHRKSNGARAPSIPRPTSATSGAGTFYESTLAKARRMQAEDKQMAKQPTLNRAKDKAAAVLEHAQRNYLDEDLKKQALNDYLYKNGRRFMDQNKEKLVVQAKAELRKELYEQVKQQLRAELKEELKDEVKAELREDLRESAMAELKEDLLAEQVAIAVAAEAAQRAIDEGKTRQASTTTSRRTSGNSSESRTSVIDPALAGSVIDLSGDFDGEEMPKADPKLRRKYTPTSQDENEPRMRGRKRSVDESFGDDEEDEDRDHKKVLTDILLEAAMQPDFGRIGKNRSDELPAFGTFAKYRAMEDEIEEDDEDDEGSDHSDDFVKDGGADGYDEPEEGAGFQEDDEEGFEEPEDEERYSLRGPYEPNGMNSEECDDEEEYEEEEYEEEPKVDVRPGNSQAEPVVIDLSD